MVDFVAIDNVLRLLLRVIIVVGVGYLLLLWRANPDVVRARLFMHSAELRLFFLFLLVSSAILAFDAFLWLVPGTPEELHLAMRVTAIAVLVCGVARVVWKIRFRVPRLASSP